MLFIAHGLYSKYMKTPIEVVKETLDKIAYLNIATVSKDNKPWNTAVWYAKDSAYNLYFVSPTNTVHANNIEHEPRCFVTIYDSTVPEGEGVGVYIDAQVTEVRKPSELVKAISYLYKAKQNKRQISDFISMSPRRIYKITPLRIWINDAKIEDELYLDYRVEVPLDSLLKN